MVVMILIEDVLTLLMLILDCCRSRVRVPLLCCLHFTIATAIVGSRSGCSCRCYSGCAWREGRVGNDLDSRRVAIVDVDNGLLRSETNKHDELDYNCN